MPRGYYRLSNIIKSKTEDDRSVLSWVDRLRLLRSTANELSTLHQNGRLYGDFDANDVLINAWDLDLLVCSLRHKDKLPDPAKGAMLVEIQKKQDMFFFGAFMIQVLTYDCQVELFSSQKERRRSSLFRSRSGKQEQKGEFGTFVEYLTRIRSADDNTQVDLEYESSVSEAVEEELRKLLAKQVTPVHEEGTNQLEQWQFSTIELCVQCCAALSENRPAADVVFDWVDSILDDLKAASNAGPGLAWDQQFGNRLNLIQDFQVSQLAIDDLPAIDSSKGDDDEGYESDDSYLPAPATKPLNLDDDEVASGTSEESSKVTVRDMKRMSINTLGLFLNKMGDGDGSSGPESVSVADIREQFRKAAAAKKSQRELLNGGRTKPKRVAQFKRVSVAAMGKFSEAFDQYNERFQDSAIITPEAVADRFDTQLRLSEDETLSLLLRAEFILKSEPNVIRVEAPAKIVGDIHGQYFDLRNMFNIAGGPPAEDSTNPPFIFLGDYVDRGSFSCEVLLYLLALKVAYPKQIVLLRGNHECDAVSSYFGFKDECEIKYGKTVFHRCLKCFQAMPIAALLNTSSGRVLCCHGGISPHVKTVYDIEEVDRFREPGMNGLLCDLLWADPVADSDDVGQGSEKVQYLPNPARGCSFKFSNEALMEFLEENRLIGIVRGHEVQEDGYRFRFVHTEGGRSTATSRPSGGSGTATNKRFVLTVFSAPNYCDRYGNKGAYIQVGNFFNVLKTFETKQFEHVVHPEPKDFENVQVKRRTAIEETCPYMPTTLGGFVKRAADFGQEFGSAKVRKIFSKFEKFPQFGAASTGGKPGRKPSTLGGRSVGRKASQLGRGSSGSTASSSVAKQSTKSKQYQAAAQSDSINEMHPQRVEERMESASKRLESRMTETSNTFGDGFSANEDDEADKKDVPAAAPKASPKAVSRQSVKSSGSNSRSRSSSHQPKTKAKGGKGLSFFDKIKRLSVRPDHRKNFVLFTPDDGVSESRPLTIKRKSFLEKEHMALVEPFAGWLSMISGTKVSSADFCTDLSDGVALCHLVKLIPESGLERFTIPSNGKKLNLFQKRENLLEFQQACRRIGLNSTFGARELEEWKLSSIIPCLIQLAKLSQKHQVQVEPAKEPQPTSLAERESHQTSKRDLLGATTSQVKKPVSPSTPALRPGLSHQPSLSELAAATPVPGAIVKSFETAEETSEEVPQKKPREPGMIRVNTVTSTGKPRAESISKHHNDTVVSFSQKELLTLQLLFVFFDRDNDGFISVEDLVALSQEEGSFLPESIAQSCVEAMDADTDNRIGTQDFLKFAAHLKELRERQATA